MSARTHKRTLDEISYGPETFLRYGLDYARHGFRIIPLGKLSKKPFMERWPERGTTDPQVIEGWSRCWPGSNFGLLTGNGLIALDVDPRNGGKKSLRKLLQKRRLPPTAEALTGAGGNHYLFRIDPALRIPNQVLAPGLEIKGESGVIVVEPSIHPVTRKEYVWLRTPQQGIADAPKWLLAMLKVEDKGDGRLSRTSPIDLTRDGELAPLLAEAIDRFPVLEQGQRNAQMTRLVGRMLGKGYNPDLTEEVVAAWWDHFYADGTISTPPSEANKTIRACIQSTIKNPNFKRSVGVDHIAICTKISLNDQQKALIEGGIVLSQAYLTTHTPCNRVTLSKRLCRTPKEESFVEALILYFTYKIVDLKETPLKATDSQIAELAFRRSGIRLKPPEIERLKCRYVTRPDRKASRFELVLQTKTGKPGIPSEYEITGLLQLLPQDALRLCG